MTRNTASTDLTEAQSTRRSVLTGIVAGTALLAGCIGSDSSTDSGMAAGDLPEYTVDEDAQPTPMVLDAETLVDTADINFLDEFSVEIAVANVGGAAITNRTIEVGLEYVYESTSRINQTLNEPSPVEVTLPEIEPGEWDTVEASVRVNAEGDWTLSSDVRHHPEFTFELAAGSTRLAPGDAVASEVGGFEITTLEPRFERALHYDTEEGGVGLFNQEATGLLAATDDEVLLVHRFAVENTNQSRSIGFGTVLVDNQFGKASIEGRAGSVITSDDMRDDLATLVLPGADEPFGNNAIEPGETKELAVIQRVEESDLSDASLAFSLTGHGDDIVFETEGTSPSLPAFDIVDESIDDDAGSDPVITMTVENSGEAAGTFRGAAQFQKSRPTASDWVFLPDGVEATLDVGERATLEIPASRGDEVFRVLPFEIELSQ